MNAANSHLEHAGGVAYVISQAGGPRVVRESMSWVDRNGIVRVGHVAVTTAGNINGAKIIIHAVGPQISAGKIPTETDRVQLRNAALNSLTQAEKERCTSIALPALSIGIYNYPVEEAASVLIGAAISYIREHQGASILKDIRFVLHHPDVRKQENIRNVFQRCLTKEVRSFTPHQSTLDSLPPPPKEEYTPKKSFFSSFGLNFNQTNEIPSHRPAVNHQREPNTPRMPPHINEIVADPHEEFKAAGVMLFKFHRGKLRVLLGFEYRLDERQEVLNPLGGKRDPRETSKFTAGRELWEESGKIISRADISDLLNQPDVIEVWYEPGRYYPVSYTHLTLPTIYSV